MSKTKHDKLHEIVNADKPNLDKVCEFLTEHIDDDQLLTHILKEIEHKEVSLGDRLSDKVADFGGSWAFIITFFAMLIGWIAVNIFLISKQPFDPYPFILLNLILSCIAAIQAPIIMMSQNRKEDKDRQRAQHDYLINLRAEMEIRNLQNNMKKLFEVQKEQLILLQELKAKVAGTNTHFR